MTTLYWLGTKCRGTIWRQLSISIPQMNCQKNRMLLSIHCWNYTLTWLGLCRAPICCHMYHKPALAEGQMYRCPHSWWWPSMRCVRKMKCAHLNNPFQKVISDIDYNFLNSRFACIRGHAETMKRSSDIMATTGNLFETCVSSRPLYHRCIFPGNTLTFSEAGSRALFIASLVPKEMKRTGSWSKKPKQAMTMPKSDFELCN